MDMHSEEDFFKIRPYCIAAKGSAPAISYVACVLCKIFKQRKGKYMPPVVDKKYSLVNMIGTVLSKLFALEAGHSKLDCDHLLVEIAVEEGQERQ